MRNQGHYLSTVKISRNFRFFFDFSGWIKVAETLLNPFGDDDEDFHINYLIDRNLQVSKKLQI